MANKKPNPLDKQSASLMCKLGSIVVHVDEGTSSDGHHFDMIALKGLIADPEVIAWIKAMQALALVPVKRNSPAQAERGGER